MAEKQQTLEQITGRRVVATKVGLPAVQGVVPVKSTAIIGIEVEVERHKTRSRGISPVWEGKDDGSLRNNGREYVTMPIQATDAPALLHNLLTQVLDQQTSSFSMRTSIHVHLNVLDLTLKQMQNTVLLYCLFEPLFFQYAGRGRWKNIYCVPINSTNMLTGFVRRGMRLNWQKYTALNLRRLVDLGTIEFRHLAGTFDVDRIVGWVNLITSLRDYVKSQDEDKLQQRLKDLPEDVDLTDLSREVFGEYADLFDITDTDVLQQCIPAMKLAFNPGLIDDLAFTSARDVLIPAAQRSGVIGLRV